MALWLVKNSTLSFLSWKSNDQVSGRVAIWASYHSRLSFRRSSTTCRLTIRSSTSRRAPSCWPELSAAYKGLDSPRLRSSAFARTFGFHPKISGARSSTRTTTTSSPGMVQPSQSLNEACLLPGERPTRPRRRTAPVRVVQFSGQDSSPFARPRESTIRGLRASPATTRESVWAWASVRKKGESEAWRPKVTWPSGSTTPPGRRSTSLLTHSNCWDLLTTTYRGLAHVSKAAPAHPRKSPLGLTSPSSSQTPRWGSRRDYAPKNCWRERLFESWSVYLDLRQWTHYAGSSWFQAKSNLK